MPAMECDETLDSCTICGVLLQKNVEPTLQSARAGWRAGATSRRWELVSHCAVCGVFLRNPRPSQDAIRRSYDSGRLYALWESERSDRERMWRERLAIVRRFAPAGSLLDVATGDAHFADVARAAGYDVVTTELSRSAAELARERGHEVLEGQLRDIDFGSRRFDIVTLWHALEHLPDPGFVLNRVRDLLQPHGVACIAVPNETRRIWRARLFRSRDPFGDLDAELEIHLTFFTPRSLRNALRLHRLKVVAFGVDDVTVHPNLLTRAQKLTQKTLAALFGWHFGRAMFVVATR